MIAWLIALAAKAFGQRFAKPALIAAAIALAVGGFFIVKALWPHNDAAQRQAEQTTRSADALGNAAAVAIDTIDNRAVTDRDIDNATATAAASINNAQSPDDVRSAVLAAVCGKPSHRNDPACQ